ncbi:MAG TPA: glycosyl hydrolase family 8 [Mycobacteriales bacterium]|nr:glycosyl hydrolase family 8 [Mycobacteriales bacterium]
MSPIRKVLSMAALLGAAACAGGSSGPGVGAVLPGARSPALNVAVTPSNSLAIQAQAAAVHFLDTFVTADGRVLRPDQGNDIVSEGQAYGMLLAEIAGRPQTVRTIWAWTQRHLQRSDALISWHATASGSVLDHQSATDADVLTAFALLRYDGLDDTALRADGRRVASAILGHEAVGLPGGNLVLVAGPWATSAPATVNPSYWMPSVFRALARFTGDGRWSRAATASVTLLAQLTANGRRLPPDWAALHGSTATATAAPGGSPAAQYGLDAQRIPVWLATGCSTAERALTARWWSILAPTARARALALSLTGQVVNSATNPLPFIASAAAARAAGDTAAWARLLADAAIQARQTPTYYGDAWLGLGTALFAGRLGTC